MAGPGPEPPLWVYGGVSDEFDRLTDSVTTGNPSQTTRALIGLPFAAVGDSLTLGRTVPAALARFRRRPSRERQAEVDEIVRRYTRLSTTP